jgi:hypothetical protein
MKVGDLVQLFVYSPNDYELSQTPMHVGIYMGESHNGIDGGWKIWINDKIESFNRRWWECREIENGSN